MDQYSGKDDGENATFDIMTRSRKYVYNIYIYVCVCMSSRRYSCQWTKVNDAKKLILPMVAGQSLSRAENSQLLNEMIVGLVIYFDPISNRQL